VCQNEKFVDSTIDNKLEDKIRGVGAESFAKVFVYKNLSIDAKTPLYISSTKFTHLSTMLRLMNLNEMNG